VQAGTLCFTANSLSNFVGRTFKVAGTLDFGGASVTGAVITTAGGTVRNVTLVKPTFAVEYDASGAPKGITLDGTNGLALDGRVTFDFDNGHAGRVTLPVGTVLTVATWTGAKPDVARWRGINCGEGMTARFEAKDNGEVVATVCNLPGLMLIIR